MKNIATVTQMDTPGLGSRKTFLIMVTVIGCIAILWPKVFYPMMFGGVTKPNLVKDHRGTEEKFACCDVVLDRDSFMNVSLSIGQHTYRKTLNLDTGELSLRQERPPHLRADGIHPAMRERGRAIPVTQTVPIIERARTPPSPPRIVEGRPGPIPGMRPPMGAGSVHQAQPKGSSMGFLMPLYTVGIVAFFLYTIMKLLFKKSVPNAPYGPTQPNPAFRKEVFGSEISSCCKRPDDGTTKLGWKEHDTIVTAIQGLIDAADEQIKRREIATGLSKDLSETTTPQNGNISNGHANSINDKILDTNKSDLEDAKLKTENLIKNEQQIERNDRKKRETNAEITIVGMELTASCEGGLRLGRPPTPVFLSRHEHSNEEEKSEPQSIFLEGSLPHESQILVSDSEITEENVIDEEQNGTSNEPAIILSSKMTLSLVNISSAEESDEENEQNSSDKESPVDEDIEIINGEEKEEE